MRSVLIVIFVFFYLLLGLPVLGAMWIIHKFAPHGPIWHSFAWYSGLSVSSYS